MDDPYGSRTPWTLLLEPLAQAVPEHSDQQRRDFEDRYGFAIDGTVENCLRKLKSSTDPLRVAQDLRDALFDGKLRNLDRVKGRFRKWIQRTAYYFVLDWVRRKPEKGIDDSIPAEGLQPDEELALINDATYARDLLRRAVTRRREEERRQNQVKPEGDRWSEGCLGLNLLLRRAGYPADPETSLDQLVEETGLGKKLIENRVSHARGRLLEAIEKQLHEDVDGSEAEFEEEREVVLGLIRRAYPVLLPKEEKAER